MAPAISTMPLVMAIAMDHSPVPVIIASSYVFRNDVIDFQNVPIFEKQLAV
jgi:hypothetical protein